MESDRPSPTEWMVLVNPAAGRQRGREDWEQVSHLLNQDNIPHRHQFSDFPRHAINLVRGSLEQGYHKFIIVGGDGSLNEVVNAIFTQTAVDPARVSVGMIPTGTGNDWARTFGIPLDYAGAVRTIRNARTLKHDVGKVYYRAGKGEGSSFFINMCGLGFDAEVNKKVSADRERGHLGPMKYQFHIFTTLLGYAPKRMTVVIDGKELKDQVFSVAVGIGQFNGGGLKQLPFAVPDDGLFDVTFIRRITRLKVIRSISRLRDGSFVGLPEVSTFRGRSIQIESEPKCGLEADGEPLGESPFRFEMIPRALTVVVP